VTLSLFVFAVGFGRIL